MITLVQIQKWHLNVVSILIAFFQVSVISCVFASPNNLGFNPRNPISEIYTYDEIASSVWVKDGHRSRVSWAILKSEVGSEYEDVRFNEGEAAKGSGRVFWSGGSQVAGKAAEQFARANGMKTLEMTWQGKALTRLTNATSYKLTAPLWNRASASFARGATGPVNVFHNASSGVRLNSVWRNVEYPILNGNNRIIYHNVFK